MTPYELIDLSISTGTRIDVQISIFITVHLAIFGGIIYVDRPLRPNEKIASLIIYTIFALFNFRIMQNQLNLSFNLSSEIAKLAEDPCCHSNNVVGLIAEEFKSGQYKLKNMALTVGHVIFYIIVTLSVLFDRALSKLGEKVRTA